MSIKTIPIENAAEVEELLRKHRFAGTSFRTNVASNDETVTAPNGRVVLKKKYCQTSEKRGRCLMPLSSTSRGLNN